MRSCGSEDRNSHRGLRKRTASRTGWRPGRCAEKAPREVPSNMEEPWRGSDGVDRAPDLWTGYAVLSKGQGGRE